MPRNPKWKKEGYDYGDAVLLKTGVDPEEMTYGPGHKHAAGVWHSPSRTISIADQRRLYPDATEEAAEGRWLHKFKDKARGKHIIGEVVAESMQERGTAVLSHELAHWQLGHSGEQEVKEARVRGSSLGWFGTSDWDEIEKEWGEGSLWGIERFEDLVTEFEVRLFQEVKGWDIGDPDLPETQDSFMNYFRVELGGREGRYEATTINRKRNVFEAASQAINNLLKKGILTKRQSKDYRRKIWSYTKRKYSS